MSFTSIKYILFLIVVAVFCYKLKPKLRNPLLLVASLAFYAIFGINNLPFLLASTILTYGAGLIIERELLGKKKLWLVLALVMNLGLLFVFKYFNFFAGLAVTLCSSLGFKSNDSTLKLLLPIGISFFVFQTTGYLMDVYRGNLKAEKNFINYALFASYFPGIVSGPIQRAGDMLPQYKMPAKFNWTNVKAGTLQFLWGAFKKMVIADRIAVLVNAAYADPSASTGFQLLVASVCYSVQIYCDFSAYSDMAIGSSRIMGIKLMRNFDRPYSAVSIQDFWRRWHISLSSWFRDYLYFPLGGNRCSKARSYLNIIIVFLVSGLWHGAAITYIVWGLLHGIYQVFGKVFQPHRDKIRKGLHISSDSKLLGLFRRLCTFALVTFAWIFFRAASITDAFTIIEKIFTQSLPISGVSALGLSIPALIVVLFASITLFVADWADSRYQVFKNLSASVVTRFEVYFILIVVILIFGSYGAGFDPMDFVYFKF
ncbi:MAG: MBOAT family protein [Oscillospiraceae bacterium]|nr:MBOAT family protein [Oscillospiraceae bacterium]